MADHDQRARPGVEQVLQRGQRVGVQVVGRLVQQQHVGLGHQQPEQLQPAPLAAGQVGDRGPLPAGAEAEPLGQLGGGQLDAAEVGGPGDLLDRLQQPQLSGQLGEDRAVLGQVAGPDGLARPGPSRCPGAGWPSSSRSSVVLPEPLTPTTATRSPGPSRQVTWSSRVRSPTASVTSSTSYTLLPSRRGGERLQPGRVPRRRLVGDQRLRGLDPEPRLAGPGRRAAAQPGQLLAQQVLPAGLGRGRLPGPLGPGQHVRGVAAVVPADRAVADLPGLLAHLVEEPAVVGDHDQRLPAGPEVLGQPGDALDVEVVGRLVQHQQVGAGDQGRGQRDPAALAAGQPLDRGVQADPGQPEPAEHLAHRRVAGPLVHLRRTRPGRRRGRCCRAGRCAGRRTRPGGRRSGRPGRRPAPPRR